MIYIVTALKSEAQAFVEKYKLKKSLYENFTLYGNEKMQVIVSGVGVANAQRATQSLMQKCDIQKDTLLNVGICAANKKHAIGSLVKIGSVAYHETLELLDTASLCRLTCVDAPLQTPLFELVDMDSFGFCVATRGVKRRCIYKVVSDHFEPQKVSKEGTKKLLFAVIEKIVQEVER